MRELQIDNSLDEWFIVTIGKIERPVAGNKSFKPMDLKHYDQMQFARLLSKSTQYSLAVGDMMVPIDEYLGQMKLMVTGDTALVLTDIFFEDEEEDEE